MEIHGSIFPGPLKIKLLSATAQAPARHTSASAGYDCRANLGHPEAFATIRPGEQAFIGLGFAMQPPKGWAGFLLPRSGLGTKQGIVLANTVGLIDQDYRQEVLACVKNTGTSTVTIKHGDRICQLVLMQVLQTAVEVVTELDESERTGGFGSTGTN